MVEEVGGTSLAGVGSRKVVVEGSEGHLGEQRGEGRIDRHLRVGVVGILTWLGWDGRRGEEWLVSHPLDSLHLVFFFCFCYSTILSSLFSSCV